MKIILFQTFNFKDIHQYLFFILFNGFIKYLNIRYEIRIQKNN